MVSDDSVYKSLTMLAQSKNPLSYHPMSTFLEQVLTPLESGAADRCIITRDHNQAELILQAHKHDISTIALESASLESCVRWFASRASLHIDGTLNGDELTLKDGAECDFRATVPYGEKAYDLRVERRIMLNGKDRLTISLIGVSSLSQILDSMGCAGLSRKIFDSWRTERKVLLIGSPNIGLARRFIYNYFPAQEVTYLTEYLGSEDLRCCFSDCTDPLDAVESIPKDQRSLVAGSLSLMIAPKLCGACSKVSALDCELLEHYPDLLRAQFSNSEYRVGRGCVVCGYHGAHGIVLIEAGALIENSDADTHDVRKAWEHGTRPLIHDAYEKSSKGMISLESAAKVGVAIPERYHLMYKSSTPKKPLTGADAFRGTESTNEGKKPLVLVVEDDPDQRAILEMVFKSANYDVDSASDGYEALTHVRQTTPDIIISDLMMPKIDGAQLLKQLKSNPLSKNIPVLILTVLSDSNREFDLLNLGADDYCEKTIQRKVLLKRVDNLLKRTKGTIIPVPA